MSTVISSFVTITCDGTCGKTITFAQTDQAEQEAFAANPWMNSLRFVTTKDQQKFIYCSDQCEAQGIGQGAHNPKVLVSANGPNAVELAAQAAKRAAKATEQLKAGTVTLG